MIHKQQPFGSAMLVRMPDPVCLFTATLLTPIGELAFVVDVTGALVAVAFTDEERGASLAELCGADATLTSAANHTDAARTELADYFAGARQTFSLPTSPRIGTPYQRRVWQGLTNIPFGTTWSYTQLAVSLGSVARAVGSANGANPISIIIPCHRVIGADGSLTGYAGGLERKRWLLAHENASRAAHRTFKRRKRADREPASTTS